MPLHISRPRLGLIVPPAHGRVPVEGPLLYGERAEFITRPLGLGAISTEGYEQVIDAVVEKAVQLATEGARAISLMGTSLSFYRGAAFTDELRAEMQRRSGVPCTTMSHAIVAALRQTGIRRVAVATAYIEEVDRKLKTFLTERGFEVMSLRGLGMVGVEAVSDVPASTLVALCDDVMAQAPRADGVLISCGGLVTLDAVRAVEAGHGLPVVSSSPAGFWDLMRIAGLDSASPGHGQLFETRATAVLSQL